ncbi:MAG: excinuclease ABC subunit UvrA [Bdellovibrionales bacterium]|nr:excinuclease ABC subunit UvrA [Bdellovibrionales bacterium]
MEVKPGRRLFIDVRGAREHNLKDIAVSIPKNKITVITGLSGSGKSSLAFDTIYAEGQRRYMDSLSNYARHFLDQLKKPDVDSISGLSPAIAIDQKTISNSPRSTVGTVTEVYDFLRLLFAKIGVPMCPEHKVPAEGQLPETILADVLAMPKGTKIIISAPVSRSKKGEFSKEFQKWAKLGFVSAKIDGELVEIREDLKLQKTKRHDIDIIIDKLVVEDKYKTRISESINKSLSLAEGHVTIEVPGGNSQHYSIHRACPVCGYSFGEIDPLLFSFNNPKGACEACNGLGTLDIEEYDEEVLTRGDEVTRTKQTRWKIKTDKESDDEESTLTPVLRSCATCFGTGLKKEALNILIDEKNVMELSNLAVEDLLQFFKTMNLTGKSLVIAEKILEEIVYRLQYLTTAGAGYLSLSRRTRTLSGGEAQRIRLASQVGAPLIGVLYVLDEPSIGLHPRDHANILKLLTEIKDRGNTVLIVEHDEETIASADYVIDIGPGAGSQGGSVIAAGTPDEIRNSKESLTGQYLSRQRVFPVPSVRRKQDFGFLKIEGASGNNLKNVDVSIPLGNFTAVTGVSGSGKSTLIMDTLLPVAAQTYSRVNLGLSPMSYQKISGLDQLERILPINQKPIGRTPRSCPATYVGLFPQIRDLFSNLPDAKMRGYTPGHFSFNVKGGRCETCMGAGYIRTSLQFLADSYVPCDSCQTRRYSPETMLIKYKDKNIADVLEMTVAEALPFFENHTAIAKKLRVLSEVGLDYITLGQSSTTLSGGEAQRIKLSRELSKASSSKTLYILDEPTTGLHTHDIAKLSQILHRLVEMGHTVVVIEHNLDLVLSADYVIDLGPEGGKNGGEVIGFGPPEQIIKNKSSVTGQYLKNHHKALK